MIWDNKLNALLSAKYQVIALTWQKLTKYDQTNCLTGTNSFKVTKKSRNFHTQYVQTSKHHILDNIQSMSNNLSGIKWNIKIKDKPDADTFSPQLS